MFTYLFVTVDVKIPSVKLRSLCQLLQFHYMEVVCLVAVYTVLSVLYV